MTIQSPEHSETAKRHEHERLEYVKTRLHSAINEAGERATLYADDVQAQKTYLWESRDEMDHVEKISARESIEQSVRAGNALVAKKQRLHKLLSSPYFGRIDFAREGSAGPSPVYIGIHHFYDDELKQNLVYDWRAPIATLFYDFETGPVHFQSPEGQVQGEVDLKRQFRIKQGRIELMIESAVNVVDDVLQEELSRTSDEGMKNIVATIQRDQNAIIRDEEAPVLIIQGVAGSGKTSIALHRIAFLLYRFKDTLSSEDILIISPNRVFADYISNVLPELGEESVNEKGMDEVASELLDGQYRFQTYFEQTTTLVEKNDDALKERLRFKSSREFLRELDRYIGHVEANLFQTEDIWIARRLVPGWLVEEVFRKHRSLGTRERLKQTAWEIEQKIGIQYNYNLYPEDRKRLRSLLQDMVRESTLRETYKQFYQWLGKPEFFRQAKGGKLEHADVFPLIYLKMQLEGLRSPYKQVKHLLIDEMQDYSPVQYAVLARLFSCNKTVLGDAYQSVNPYSASSARDIQRAFIQASCVTLNTSYRSSYEITQFAQRISPNPDLRAIKRHGKPPEVEHHKTAKAEADRILALAHTFEASTDKTLGIICKTQKQADALYAQLAPELKHTTLLTESSAGFSVGVIVCTAFMAKGLEFDQVIVPAVNARTYHTAMDRNLLYVACTRAMHGLVLTYSGSPSEFVPSMA